MKSSLLFSSYPFITSEKATLTRITDMDMMGFGKSSATRTATALPPKARCVPPESALPNCGSLTRCSKKGVA